MSGTRCLSAASALAMAAVATTLTTPAMAQSGGGEKKQDLPPINVTAPEARRSGGAPARTAGAGAARRRTQPVRQVQPAAQPKP